MPFFLLSVCETARKRIAPARFAASEWYTLVQYSTPRAAHPCFCATGNYEAVTRSTKKAPDHQKLFQTQNGVRNCFPTPVLADRSRGQVLTFFNLFSSLANVYKTAKLRLQRFISDFIGCLPVISYSVIPNNPPIPENILLISSVICVFKSHLQYNALHTVRRSSSRFLSF